MAEQTQTEKLDKQLLKAGFGYIQREQIKAIAREAGLKFASAPFSAKVCTGCPDRFKDCAQVEEIEI